MKATTTTGICLLSLLLASCALFTDRRAQCEAGPPVVPVGNWQSQESGLESIRFERDSFALQLLFVWKHAPDAFALRGLNPLGIEVFRLDVAQEGTRWQTLADAQMPLQADRLLADFQLVHWPLEVLQEAYAETPWVLQSRGNRRELSCYGAPMATVQKATGSPAGFILSNIPGGYRLHGQALGGQ